jgi:predicted lipoprotein with Yx(FWY)xxD motif
MEVDMCTKNPGKVAILVLASVLYVAGSGPVEAQTAAMPAGVEVRKLESGVAVLADAKGMTLYTFAKDMAGMSHCAGPCAQNWPPLAAAADAKPTGEWTIVAREDGTKQWAYKGMPLYTWIKDAKPGDATGEGMAMGAWRVAVP